MLASDVVLVGGMGYVVPVGGLEITGVLLFELLVSVALHAVNNSAAVRRRVFTQRRKVEKETQRMRSVSASFFTSLRLCVKRISLDFILFSSNLVLILGHGLAGHTILALDPTAEIYQLTPF
jgi:hypothetical protein